MEFIYRIKRNESGLITAIYQSYGRGTTGYYFSTLTSKTMLNMPIVADLEIVSEEIYLKLFKIFLGQQGLETEKFAPVTRYTLHHHNFILEGYSRKEKEELCHFFMNEAKTGPFIILDKDGLSVAIIASDIASEASYTFETL
jgi:hypothetical protein